MVKQGCPHLPLIPKVEKEELLARSEGVCSSCKRKEKLWGCLQEGCSFNGCGESVNDHSTEHYQKSKHAVAVNFASFRIWCYACEAEVKLPFDFTSSEMKALRKARRQKMSQNHSSTVKQNYHHPEPVSIDPRAYNNPMQIPPGLVGLRNMGNTCYMNAALQALSNCVPMTNYFLNNCDYTQVDRAPSMTKHYFRLVHEMWNHQQQACITPNGVCNTLKSINPSFRGYHQQDAQEFLRCFMDRLHEELKYIVPKWTYDHSSIDTQQEEKNREMETDLHDSDRAPSTTTSSTDSFTIVSESDSVKQQSNDVAPDVSAAAPLQQNRPSETEQEGLAHSIRTNHSSSEGNWRRKSSEGHFRQQRRKMDCHNGSNKPAKKPAYQYRSIISEIFDGELRSSVQCLQCDQVSHTRETFQDLSLPIPGKDDLARLHGTTVSYYPTTGAGSFAITPGFKGPCTESSLSTGYIYNTAWNVWEWLKSWFWGPQVSLNDCLSAFFSADELKGDNMYSCNKCNKLRNGVKYCKLLQLPEVLCIHLKRFRHEYMMSYSSKISSPVSFPIKGLDLKKFLAQDTPSTCTTYDLCSVIVHLGNAGGGHYTAYAKNFVDNNWYEFDDQFISPVSESIVSNAEAYVLFYCKSSQEATHTRERISQIENSRMETEGNSKDLLQFYISTRWLYKFLNFVEPGPIDNSDFVCRHLGVLPSAVQDIGELQKMISETTWRELHDRFGGGPAVTSLQLCHICDEEQMALQDRRENEKEAFLQLTRNAGEPEHSVYISLEWFHEWEAFINEKLPEPPGMVDNRPICYTKEGKHVLRKSSPHAPIPRKAWDYLISIYGGGPEVTPRVRAPSPASPTKAAQDLVQRPRTPSTPPVEQKEPEYMEVDRGHEDAITGNNSELNNVQGSENLQYVNSELAQQSETMNE